MGANWNEAAGVGFDWQSEAEADLQAIEQIFITLQSAHAELMQQVELNRQIQAQSNAETIATLYQLEQQIQLWQQQLISATQAGYG
ncbi:MAG TPA: hypothetical protein V6D10_20610 [Trichocoleus sp.]|jgi:hypothetical protein